jgi:hypothetical protein
MVRWLKLFTLDNAMMGVLIIVLLTASFIPNEIRYLTLSSCLFFGLVTANFFLFFRPEILYGLPQPVSSGIDQKGTHQKKSARRINEEDSVGLSEITEIPAFIYEYKVIIDNFLNKSKRYLDPDFNIQDLSRETGLPKHHLQLLIHNFLYIYTPVRK